MIMALFGVILLAAAAQSMDIPTSLFSVPARGLRPARHGIRPYHLIPLRGGAGLSLGVTPPKPVRNLPLLGTYCDTNMGITDNLQPKEKRREQATGQNIDKRTKELWQGWMSGVRSLTEWAKTFVRDIFTSVDRRKELGRALWAAVAAGDEDAVIAALQQGASPLCKLKDLGPHEREKDNLSEKTPLHVAAHMGNTPLVRILMKHCKKIDPRDELGKTPLWKACAKGRLGAANVLLKLGADPNAQAYADMYEAPLHVAVRRRYVATVKLLLQYGADVNIRTQFLETPLHTAAQAGWIQLAKLLLIAGVDYDARALNQRTAFVMAQDHKNYQFHNYMRKVHDGRISVVRMQRAHRREMAQRQRRDQRRRQQYLASRNDRGGKDDRELEEWERSLVGEGVRAQEICETEGAESGPREDGQKGLARTHRETRDKRRLDETGISEGTSDEDSMREFRKRPKQLIDQ